MSVVVAVKLAAMVPVAASRVALSSDPNPFLGSGKYYVNRYDFGTGWVRGL